jgi:glycosyltransferase involved in cell wall biosynthesis
LLGIGVITYNRLARLRETLDALEKYTTTPYKLFVADDGSTDNTKEYLCRAGIPHHSSRNRGVAWNKNRALFYFLNIDGIDTIILLEDDTRPTRKGWENVWIAAAWKLGHANLAGGWFINGTESGTGTPDDPFMSASISGQCIVFSRAAVAVVGYYDSRFRGFGCEHVEHSQRMVRAGIGGKFNPACVQAPFLFALVMADLNVTFEHSFMTPEKVAEGVRVMQALHGQPIYREPWQNKAEKSVFLAEMAESGVDGWETSGQMIFSASKNHGAEKSVDEVEEIVAPAKEDGLLQRILKRVLKKSKCSREEDANGKACAQDPQKY